MPELMRTILSDDCWVSLYGPSGTGKSTVGRHLADQLNLPFWDLDEIIAKEAGSSIPEIFKDEGEPSFRARESTALQGLQQFGRGVLSLGGGTLLSPENRALVEARGPVFCLTAELETLLNRVNAQRGVRPLLAGDTQERMVGMIQQRMVHYASFPHQIITTHLPAEAVAWQIQVVLGWYHVQGMGPGYDVLVQPGGISGIGEAMNARSLSGPVAVVTDENVAPLYAEQAAAGLSASGYTHALISIPPGEAHKNLERLQDMWRGFLQCGLERRSTVLALGGGVVGDLAGFAASTYLRGVPWVVLPTTLLAMVDASIGGKTGADLPEGKNLVGAFHPPSLVLADPETLRSLPRPEMRSGLAEVVKHGVIGDPELFQQCQHGYAGIQDWTALVRRAIGVKVRVIQDDPYEKGIRQSLNLGHTVGHGIELASGFRLRHGEAVAIGMVAEARLAARIGLADAALPDKISACLRGLGLPTEIPTDLDHDLIIQAMSYDKKKAGGKVRFALPVQIGQVEVGVEIPDLALALQ